ncbi:PaaI family thioesterase [Clostridium botulinum]|uniref:Thioesterase n=1 Tax=Clostridium botulinum C/D str. DC5 TaxID=1443128 RepID=A0A0A0I8F6_CLOBO|nr:PaaI family thioesterase [Clostridium botulinum]KEI04539.1 thioesterase [Clostridium botulinum C/D str. BKT75002]KEI07342.1 thioesterase [Clostridium botulinum C/D str. BKT2873]KGM95945.1 thioesterase [Clostridium botulinum C/D str. DC5]KGM97984.1 thioesterase [Clostridium botulinum D str. CCUG 7971]KOC46151.1 thioesterase [Clostridium botulinum]
MKTIDRYGKLEHANCVNIMEPKLVEYKKEESLTVIFPVLEKYLNPLKSMQGGFITAAFDNSFGIFFIAENNGELITTIDITTSYQRPIFLGDNLKITVKIKQAGDNIVHMYGEGYNKEGKLVATCSTNIMRINNKNK